MFKQYFIIIIITFFSFNSFAKNTNENLIDKSILIDATIENIWSALTSEEELSLWWNKGVRLEPVVNGEFYEPWGDGQLATGTVKALRVNDYIEFTWKEKYFNSNQLTICRFSLIESRGRVFLNVKHSGWETFKDEKQRDELITGFKGAWDFYLSKLKNYLEGK